LSVKAPPAGLEPATL